MNIFQKIWNWLLLIFSKTEKFIQDNIVNSITFVNKVKEIVNNPLLDSIVLLTPTDFDNKILKVVRENIGVAIDALQIADTCIEKPSLEEKVKCFIEELRKLSPEMQKAVYQRLAVILSKLSIKDVDNNDLAIRIEKVYQLLSKK